MSGATSFRYWRDLRAHKTRGCASACLHVSLVVPEACDALLHSQLDDGRKRRKRDFYIAHAPREGGCCAGFRREQRVVVLLLVSGVCACVHGLMGDGLSFNFVRRSQNITSAAMEAHRANLCMTECRVEGVHSACRTVRSCV